MTRRLEQVESTLQRAIALVLQREVSDPRIRGMVSITRVKVSPDLADAQVFVSIMPARYEGCTMSGLHRATGRIRRMTHDQVALKTMPRLRFELDQSLKNQARVFQALEQAKHRTGEAPEAAADEPDQPETPDEPGIAIDPPTPDEPRPQ
jgi:ribosome-binding factor A